MSTYIGNVEIKGKTVLAPMAGICNSAFRKIIKEQGCALIYAEMVSDKAIFYENKKTKDMLYMEDDERPIAQQIFGSDVDTFVMAAKYIEENMKPDIIDINMGCPVPKVAVHAQAGSALLKNPEKIKEIARETNVPVIPIPPLARSLYYTTELDTEIPRGLFKAVAQVLAWVMGMKAFKEGKSQQRPRDLDMNPYIPDELRF